MQQQPTYLYSSELDKEVRWRSKFPIGIPIFLGLIQLILTFIIIGLEIASVIISPIFGTLYAGFWCSVLFILSWISMLGLVCCHRSRKWCTFVFGISLLCAGAAITLIVLDALFIGNIIRCFFTNSICNELSSSSYRGNGQPIGSKVRFIKGQIVCAAIMLATAILYMLLYIFVLMSSRQRTNRVLIEQTHLPSDNLRRTTNTQIQSQQGWKSTSVPVTYEPSQLECPHCGTIIRIEQRNHGISQLECPHCGTLIKLAQKTRYY